MKSKWNRIRSEYTVAVEKYTRSGQGDADNFRTLPMVIQHYLTYIAHSKTPSLHYVVRTLLGDARVEEGIEEVAAYDFAMNITPAKRKLSSADALSSGMQAYVKLTAAPITISDASEGRNEVFKEFEISNRMADTVENLMKLEMESVNRIRNANVTQDFNFSSLLEERLKVIRSRIDKALEH